MPPTYLRVVPGPERKRLQLGQVHEAGRVHARVGRVCSVGWPREAGQRRLPVDLQLVELEGRSEKRRKGAELERSGWPDEHHLVAAVRVLGLWCGCAGRCGTLVAVLRDHRRLGQEAERLAQRGHQQRTSQESDSSELPCHAHLFGAATPVLKYASAPGRARSHHRVERELCLSAKGHELDERPLRDRRCGTHAVSRGHESALTVQDSIRERNDARVR